MDENLQRRTNIFKICASNLAIYDYGERVQYYFTFWAWRCDKGRVCSLDFLPAIILHRKPLKKSSAVAKDVPNYLISSDHVMGEISFEKLQSILSVLSDKYR